MCYAKPGPRCSGHTRAELKTAEINYANNPTTEHSDALTAARLAHAKSPEGIKALRKSASDAIARGDIEGGVRTTQLADSYDAERESRLSGHNLLNTGLGAVAYAEQAQSFAGNSSFTLIKEALFDGAYVNGYSTDLNHEMDRATDEIRISADWSIHNPAAMYYQHRDKLDLDPDHRPTRDEAEELASDFHQSLIDDGLLPDTDEAEEQISYAVAEKIAGAYRYDYPGGDDLREDVIARLQESIVFDHSVSSTASEEAVMDLLAYWDDAYSDDGDDDY